MSNEKSSESTSYSGSGQLWAKPFAKQGANAVMNAFNKYQPGVDMLLGKLNRDIIPQLQGRMAATGVGAGQASQYYQDILRRGPQENPYLQGMIDRTNSDVRNGVNNNFSLAGRYGSGNHVGVMTDRLADAENSLRYQDYANQQGLQQQAAGALTQADQASAQPLLGAIGLGGELPWGGVNSMANSLGALFSGGNSKSVSYAPSPWIGALGAGLGAAGAYFSDRRLKKDITPIGEGKHGMTLYSWIYKNDPSKTVCTGYMADEVKTACPAAYIENFRGTGYAGVDYGKL